MSGHFGVCTWLRVVTGANCLVCSITNNSVVNSGSLLLLLRKAAAADAEPDPAAGAVFAAACAVNFPWLADNLGPPMN